MLQRPSLVAGKHDSEELPLARAGVQVPRPGARALRVTVWTNLSVPSESSAHRLVPLSGGPETDQPELGPGHLTIGATAHVRLSRLRKARDDGWEQAVGGWVGGCIAFAGMQASSVYFCVVLTCLR